MLAGSDEGGLVARQITVDGGNDCTIESTCSECYGAGNVLCSNAGCFDPSQGQQCCADGCMLPFFSWPVLEVSNSDIALQRTALHLTTRAVAHLWVFFSLSFF